MEISSQHLPTQTVRARDLEFERRFNFHHMACVMCQLSHVACHLSLYDILIIVLANWDKVEKLVGEGLLSIGPSPSSL